MASSVPPPGTADIFPEEVRRWQYLESCAADIFGRYNYGELRTPVFEYTEVFQRGLGDDTEVVQKEMYTFEDRGGRSLTLRPEGTAGVMRALLNTDVMNGVEQRVFYHGPMFRGERPAAGRRRQFHQIGVENVGRVSPETDAECIAMLIHFLEEIGIKDAELKINTRGVMDDRPAAAAGLREYFSRYINDMCDDCKVRFEKNIWRILDCKQEKCRAVVSGAPDYVKSFSPESQKYFADVLAALDALGVRYTVDRELVRGLDYYVHTVFELTHGGLGAQTAIAGGGRYELYLPGNNRPVQGVGFAAGMERLLMVQDALGVKKESPARNPIFLVSTGDEARAANLQLAARLRRGAFSVAMELESKSVKAQMRSANRYNSRIALIRGGDELAAGTVVLKVMESGEQQTVAWDNIEETIKTILIN